MLVRQRIAVVAALVASGIPSVADANVSISNKPTKNMSCTAGVCSPTAKKAVLNVGDLANMLATGDVKITSDGLAQDIEIDAGLSWTSPQRLTLDSYRSIVFSKSLTVAGPGALTITTNGGGPGGDFVFFGKAHVEFWELNLRFDRLTINGQAYELAKNIKQIARAFELAERRGGSAYVALAKDYDAARDGIYAHPVVAGELSGALEGLGNIVSNLTIKDSTDRYVGFVALTNFENGMVRDFALAATTVDASENQQNPQYVGGLIADAEYVVFRCFVTGRVSAGPNAYVGGLVGQLYSDIRQSHADILIAAGDGSLVGGLVGYSHEGRALQSFAAGGILGGNDSIVGGLLGEGWTNGFGTLTEDSYSTVSVSGGENAEAGGLVGATLSYRGGKNVVRGSYSTGAVTGGTGGTVGGFIGSYTSSGNDISNAYWDIDTSGINDLSQGCGNIEDCPGVTGLTDAQLESGLPAGFDPSVWGQDASINNGYPYLLANLPQ
jgi:hypothetical protein